MEQIIITHKDGTTLKLNSSENVSQITKASQTVELLGADTIDISVTSAKKLKFLIGDKITIIGRDYTLNTPAKEKKISEVSFQYDLQFEGVQYDLLRAAYNVNVDTTSNEIQDLNGDSLTGDIKMFLDVLISNANRVFGTGKWSIGTYPTGTKTITLTFNDTDNCLSVLQTICGEDNFNTEFDISIDSNGNRTINIGSVGNIFNYTFEYGKGKGIYDLTREKVSSSNIVTRLNVFGGTKNIVTTKYRASKLCLPNKSKSQSYIEDADAISKYGVWEGAKDFEDIYPSRTGTISALGDSVLKFIDSSMDFDLNAKDADGNTIYMMSGTTPKVHFNTGNLAGYEFDIKSYDATTKQFTINSQTDQNDYTFPSTTSAAFQFSVGDEYVLIDIYMPQTYVTTAENKLLQAGTDYLEKYSQPLVQYGLTVDKFFLKNQVGAEAESNIIWVGDYIPVKDADIDVDKAIRVKGFTRDLLDDYSYSLTIADLPVTITTITRVIRELSQVDKVLNINNLNDPARARRNYLATTELTTMIETIKEEAALIGGGPAAQYELTGVAITANYGGNSNAIYLTAGTIAHNYYPIGNPGTWNISVGSFSGLTAATAYYLYIKASTSSSSASYYISSTKIEVESVAGYYHFPLGILSSVINGARVLQTTKGYTLITGDCITTGKVKSTDGNSYFDLSTGEFKGIFKFTSGTSVETAVNSAQTQANTATTNAATAQTAANNAASAASAAQTSANTANSAITDMSSDDVISPVEKPALKKEYDAIVSELSKNDSQADAFSVSRTTYDAAYSALNTYIGTNLNDLTTSWSLGTGGGATLRSKFKTYYDSRTDLLNAIAAKAKTLADAAQSSVDNLQIGGRNLVLNSARVITNDTSYSLSKNLNTLLGQQITIAYDYNYSNVSTGSDFNKKRIGCEIACVVNGTSIYLQAWIQLTASSSGLSGSGRAKFTVTIPAGTTNSIPSAYLYIQVVSGTVQLSNFKIEVGNKATDYTVAPEDIDANILTAQTTANNAASAASSAQTDATNALGQLSNITSDNILSVAEKSGERQAWNVIYDEKSNLDSEATNFGITTEKNTYDNAFQSLATYLNNGNPWSSGVPSWLSDSALPTNTAIVGSTYRSNWEALYTSRVNLRIAISTKAKTLADAAQTQANTATTNAATAQTTANNAASAASAAQTDASSAISKIYNITSDNILSASEKPSQRQAWDNILDEKSGIDTQATNFGITTEKTNYDNYFQTLATYLNAGTTWTSGIPSWLTNANIGTDTSIVGSTYRTNWTSFYSSRTVLLNAIAAKAKTLADAAQTQANTATTNAATAQTTANNAASAASSAQTDATNALGQLTNITSDNVLSVAEKSGERNNWNIIASEKSNIDSQADTFGVSRTSYDSAFKTLATYLNAGTTYSSGIPSWLADANMSVNTNIVGSTYRSNWQGYYDARTALLNAISTKAKALADAAQTQANTATTNAATAQTTANNASTAAAAAQTDASNALGQLTNITSDNVLSSAEKPSQLQEWNVISAEKSGIDTQATNFSITTEKTAYDNAFQALATYLNAGTTWTSGTPAWLAALSTNTTIVGSTYRTNWQTFYNARTALLQAISTKAKALADAAQSSVDNLQIGGRNLVLNSARVITNDTSYSLSKNLNTLLGQQITIAYDYNYSNVSTGSDFNKKRIGCEVQCVVNSTYIYLEALLQLTASSSGLSGSGRAKFTVTIPAGTTNSIPSAYLYIQVVSGTVQLSNFKIEVGNKATDYTVAPEDVQANITAAQTSANNAASAASALQYLATALQGSTDINGGLLATNVLLMKDSGGNITGGMSGLSSDNIAVWGGGTYQNALDALAKMIMRKDGSGQLASGKILWDLAGNMYVGNFAIEAGAISGYADNKNKVKFHTGTIPTLSSLVNGGIVQDSTTYSPSQTNRFPNSTTGDQSFSFQNITYGSITVPANTTVYLTPPITTKTYTNCNISIVNQYYEFVLGSTVIGDYTSSTSQIVLSAGGTYTVKYYTNIDVVVPAQTNGFITLATTTPGYLSYQIGVERTEIGKDGFYSYWGANSYLHYSQSGGLNFKGTMNLPGVLASASVASAGGSSNKWGPKVGDSSKSTTGTYTINHSIGHVNYNVIITGITDTGRVGCCSAKTTTSCTIKMVSLSNLTVDSNFDYVIIGSN